MTKIKMNEKKSDNKLMNIKNHSWRMWMTEKSHHHGGEGIHFSKMMSGPSPVLRLFTLQFNFHPFHDSFFLSLNVQSNVMYIVE